MSEYDFEYLRQRYPFEWDDNDLYPFFPYNCDCEQCQNDDENNDEDDE